jgi:hypothetical protein
MGLEVSKFDYNLFDFFYLSNGFYFKKTSFGFTPFYKWNIDFAGQIELLNLFILNFRDSVSEIQNFSFL